MHIKGILLASLMMIGIITIISAEESNSSSTATLPLEDILHLYQRIEDLKKPSEEEVPVKALIQSIELKGQLLEHAIDIQAAIQVKVMADNTWTSIPLFTIDRDTHISGLPDLNQGTLVHMDDTLSLLTEKKGTYSFTISFIKRARTSGAKNNVQLLFEKASRSVLALKYDTTYVAINKNTIQTITPDGVIIYPDNNIYTIEWKNIERAENKKATESIEKKPEIKSMIKIAHASLISTLEGKTIFRILYELHFTGEKTISFFIPNIYTLEKVYINKRQHFFTMNDDKLTLHVNPKRTGDQCGDVELIVSYNQGNYLLSGRIEVSLPQTTWPIHEMYFTSHLPEVFDYTYRGGSLKLVDSCPPADYTYHIPLPGKKLYYHQYLISSSYPSVTLDYTINLDGNYFLGNR
jgi:hypothetical protein